MEKKFFGLSLKWWLVGAALAVGVGLWWRSHSAAQQPAGKQVARPAGHSRTRTRTTITKPGKVVVINRIFCPPGYHRVGKRCVRTHPKHKASK